MRESQAEQDPGTAEDVKLRGASLLPFYHLLCCPTPTLIRQVPAPSVLLFPEPHASFFPPGTKPPWFCLTVFSHDCCPLGLCSLPLMLKLWRQSNVGSHPPPSPTIFDLSINLILLSLVSSAIKGWMAWLSKLNYIEYVRRLMPPVSPALLCVCGEAPQPALTPGATTHPPSGSPVPRASPLWGGVRRLFKA